MFAMQHVVYSTPETSRVSKRRRDSGRIVLLLRCYYGIMVLADRSFEREPVLRTASSFPQILCGSTGTFDGAKGWRVPGIEN